MKRQIKNEIAYKLQSITQTTETLLKVRAGQHPEDLTGCIRTLRRVDDMLHKCVIQIIQNQKKRGAEFPTADEIDALIDKIKSEKSES